MQGGTDTNTGFDGASYTPAWPRREHQAAPTAFHLTSPGTGTGYHQARERAAFEANLSADEPTCNRTTGTGCTLIPLTDSGDPAQFYPFFTNTNVAATCRWHFGNDTSTRRTTSAAMRNTGRSFP